MRARTKFLIQVILAIITAYILKNILLVPQLYWPGLHVEIDLGIWYIPIAAFVIVLMSNAMNLDRWSGWASRVDLCDCFRCLREHRPDAGQFICRTFLLHHRRCIIRFPLVQCSPRHAFHGRSGLIIPRGCTRRGCTDDGQWLLLPLMAVIPISNSVSVILQVALFQTHQGKALVQNGAAAPSF